MLAGQGREERMWYLVVNLLLAAIPSLLLVLYFYRKDRQRREPPRLIWSIFLAGFLAVVPAALIEQLFSALGRGSTPAGAFVRAFAIAGLVEEGTKLLVVRLFVYGRPEFDEVADGIIYTITAGLGFAFFENLLYSFGPFGFVPPGVLLMRGVTAVPLHAVAAGIMGYYIGRSKFGERRLFGRGLLYAVLIHGSYDWLLFTGSWPSLFVLPLLFFGFRVLQNLYRRALAEDRAEGRS